jgi:hypothetical protein
MRLSRHVLAPAVAVALCFTAGACGSTPAGSIDPPAGGAVRHDEPTARPSDNDPALLRAADVLEPLLKRSFPAGFSGLAIDNARHQVIIYRRPDPALDAAVRAHAPARVRVVIRDAKFSLREMDRLANQIMADSGYWRDRGVSIQSAGPKVDGSGVAVGTARGPADAPALARRYGAGTLTVERLVVAPL